MKVLQFTGAIALLFAVLMVGRVLAQDNSAAPATQPSDSGTATTAPAQ